MSPPRRTILLAVVVTLNTPQGFAQLRFSGGFAEDQSEPIVQTEGGEWVNQARFAPRAKLPRTASTCRLGQTRPVSRRSSLFSLRIIFRSVPGRPSWLGWINDYPDADLNVSARLQQLTSIKTDPDRRVLKLTDRVLTDYPFIFMSHPERMELRDDEVMALITAAP